MEIWKDIPNTEGCYQVSNYGRFKSVFTRLLNKGSKFSYKKERILKLGKYSNDYLQFSGNVNNKRVTGIAHRLVAQAFIPNPENKPQVNHLDGNKQNNHVDNLCWATISENIRHSYEVLNRKTADQSGVNNKNVKLTEKQVREIRNRYDNLKHTIFEISKDYKVKKAAIWKIVSRYNWKHLTN